MSRSLSALRIILFLGATGAVAFGIWQQMQGAAAPYDQPTVFGFWCKVAGGLALLSLATLAIADRDGGAGSGSAPARRADESVPSYIVTAPEIKPQRRDGQSTWQERLAARNADHARRNGGLAAASAPAQAAAPRAAGGFGALLRRAVFVLIFLAFAAALGAALIGTMNDAGPAAGARATAAHGVPGDGTAAGMVAQHHQRVRATLGSDRTGAPATAPAAVASNSATEPAGSEGLGAMFDDIDTAALRRLAEDKVAWFKATLERAMMGDRDAMMLLGGIFGAIVAAFVVLRALSGIRRGARRGARRQSVQAMGLG